MMKPVIPLLLAPLVLPLKPIHVDTSGILPYQSKHCFLNKNGKGPSIFPIEERLSPHGYAAGLEYGFLNISGIGLEVLACHSSLIEWGLEWIKLKDAEEGWFLLSVSAVGAVTVWLKGRGVGHEVVGQVP